MAVVTITNENLNQEIIFTDKTVLIAFWADWAGPSKKLLPILEEISKEYGDKVKVGTINSDVERDLAAEFHAFRLPMMLIIKDRKVVNEVMGFRSKEKILELLNL